MLTRRTFFTSAAVPAALPFYRPHSPIELAHADCRRLYRETATLDDDDGFYHRSIAAAEKHLFSLRPQTLREMALQVHALELDPEWHIWVPGFLKHVDIIVGEFA